MGVLDQYRAEMRDKIVLIISPCLPGDIVQTYADQIMKLFYPDREEEIRELKADIERLRQNKKGGAR